jgi:aryl sulfotransferase
MPTLLRAAAREYRSHIMDSHRWDGFKPRQDDIVVATYPKCGTTWTQRIVDLLIFQSPAPRPFQTTAPWIDAVFFAPVADDLATLEAQTHRRAMKSHLPFDALPLYDGVKYIHVARDGRDACWSFHNHQLGFRTESFVVYLPDGSTFVPPPPPPTPQDPREFFLAWMDRAEASLIEGGDLPFCEFETTYWKERRRDSLLLVHYNDLKADLAGEMRRISDFLDIATPAALLPRLAEAARFETMKAQGDEMMPQLRKAFDAGAQRFIDKGTNGRWKDVLTPDDLARYDALVARKLSPAAARWIAQGRLVAGDPRMAAD